MGVDECLWLLTSVFFAEKNVHTSHARKHVGRGGGAPCLARRLQPSHDPLLFLPKDRLDADVAGEPEPDHKVLLPDWCDAGKFLPAGAVIPGALHLIDNLTKEISNTMAHYETFHRQLKMFGLLWE